MWTFLCSLWWSAAWADHQPFIKVQWWCHWTNWAEVISLWDLIYYKLMAVKNVHRKNGVNESMAASRIIPGNHKYIRGTLWNSLSKEGHHFQQIVQQLCLQASYVTRNQKRYPKCIWKGQKEIPSFYKKTILDKSVQLRDTIHGGNQRYATGNTNLWLFLPKMYVLRKEWRTDRSQPALHEQ